jgi:acetyl esterase
MSTLHLVDPEIAPMIALFPSLDMTFENLADVRANLGSSFPAPPEPSFLPEIVAAPSRDGAPDVPLYVYNPKSKNRSRPAILHIHGGGMVLGSAEMSRASMPPIAEMFDVVIVLLIIALRLKRHFLGPRKIAMRASLGSSLTLSSLGSILRASLLWARAQAEVWPPHWRTWPGIAATMSSRGKC